MNEHEPKLPLCKICDGQSEKIFDKLVLLKHNVAYFRCVSCGFTQTENPHWLDEAYTPPTSPLDIGAVCRPVALANLTANLLNYNFEARGRFLDYGGGVGLFTRLMRDRGYDFFRFDKYCSNTFAQYFDFEDLPSPERNFELVTCFEVLEHTSDPLAEVEQIFRLGKHLLCTTSLLPESSLEEVSEWAYLGAEHGQHTSFLTRRSLQVLSERFDRYLYTNGHDLHLFSQRRLHSFDFDNIQRRTLPYRGGAAIIRLMQKVLERALGPRPSSTPEVNQDEEFVLQRFLAEKRTQQKQPSEYERNVKPTIVSPGSSTETRSEAHPLN